MWGWKLSLFHFPQPVTGASFQFLRPNVAEYIRLYTYFHMGTTCVLTVSEIFFIKICISSKCEYHVTDASFHCPERKLDIYFPTEDIEMRL